MTPSAAPAGFHVDPPARVGDSLAAVDTPALVLDLDACDANIQAMHGAVASAGLKLRSHGKAHRCPHLGLKQIAAGAVGLCVQKVGEAEGFAAAGVRDLLVTNEVVDPAKLLRLAKLAAQPGMRIGVCVDDVQPLARLIAACRQAGSRIDVMIEIDVGQRRCGVPTAEQALALAQAVAAAPDAVRLRGLQAYHGRAQHLRTPAERSDAVSQAAAFTNEVRALLATRGHAVEEISGGGTGTFPDERGRGVWTELQAGSYALMDLDYRANTHHPDAPALRQAMGVLTSVLSVAHGRLVLDGGLKAVSVDSGLPAVRLDGWRVAGLSDEHTVLLPARDAGAPQAVLPPGPAHGERLILDPGHCDPTCALHDFIVAYRGDRVEAVWPTLPRSASR